jgi:putative SOS response-associated peptidase YedK
VWTRHPGEPSRSKIIDALDPRDNRVTGDPFGNVPPRYNGAPSQQLWVIRQNPQTGE